MGDRSMGMPRGGALVIAVVVIVAGCSTVSEPSRPAELAGPSATMAPSAVAAPSASGELMGWPGSRGGPAGSHFWDMRGQAWMHHVSGGGVGVELTFEIDGDSAPTGWPTGMIAGFPAWRSRGRTSAAGAQIETWLVPMDDQVVRITMAVNPGSEPATIAEGREVLASLRRVPGPHGKGFRLVFDTRSVWDSG